MKDRRNDGFLIFFVLVALCVEMAVLLHQMRFIQLPIPLERTPLSETPVGEILEKNNVLKNRTVRSLSWYPMAAGDPVGRNSTVMTGPDSSAKVKLQSGGLIELESDTLISFGVERTLNGSGPLTLLVDQGALKVQSAKEAVTVRVDKKEIRLDADSQMTVSQAPMQKAARITVQKGSVALARAEDKATAPIAIGAGDSVVMNAEEVKKVPKALNIAPEYPLPGARLLMQSPEMKAAFRWKGDAAEKVEIDRQPSFDSAESFPANETQADVKLTPGKYFWRVSKPGVAGPSYDFIVLPQIVYSLSTPVKDAQLKSDLRIRLQWEPIEAATRYLIQVSKESDFSDPLIEKEVDETGIDLGLLGEGNYFWRVRAEHKELGPWPFSESSTFTVKKPLGAPKLKGVKLLEKTSFLFWLDKIAEWLLPSAHAAEKEKPREAEVVFEWEAIAGASSYHFELCEKEDFSGSVMELDSATPSTKMKIVLKKKYYWRVAARDGQGDLGAFSAVEPFVIDEPPKPKVVEVKKPEPKKEEKKEEPKKPEPPKIVKAVPALPLTPMIWWRLGGSRTSRFESIRSQTYEVSQKDSSWNRFPLAFAWTKGNQEVQFRFSTEDHTFKAKSGTLQNTQPNLDYNYVTASIWFKGLFSPKKRPPFILGLSYRQRPAFIRSGYESLRLESIPSLGAVLGPSWFVALNKSFSLRTDLLLEVYPFGQMRGMALYGEMTLGTKWRLLGLTPEIQATAIPAYYTITPHVVEGTSFDFSLALLLRYNFGL